MSNSDVFGVWERGDGRRRFGKGVGEVGSRRRCAVDRYVRYESRRMESENLPSLFGACPACDRLR